MEDWVKRLFMEAKPGWDVHKLCASRMFNVPYGEVTDEQRRAAKQQNFYDLYSMPMPGDEPEASPLQKALMEQLQREGKTPTGRRFNQRMPDFQEVPKHDTRMRSLLKSVSPGRQPPGAGYRFIEFDSSRTDYGDVEMRVLAHDEVAPVTLHKFASVGWTSTQEAAVAAGRASSIGKTGLEGFLTPEMLRSESWCAAAIQTGKRILAHTMAQFVVERLSVPLPPALTGPARRQIVNAVKYAVANWSVDTDHKV